MSYVLRHNPARYGLQPDRHGYVDLDAFFLIAKRRYPGVEAERLHALIEADHSGRFEVAGRLLRARYGHSIPADPPSAPVEPPQRLYHGTVAEHVKSIRTHGLRPIDRRMIHLSETIDDAVAVARRKTDQPVVFCINARDASAAGILFYQEAKIFLASYIPASFVRLEPLPAFSAPPHLAAPDAPPAPGV